MTMMLAVVAVDAFLSYEHKCEVSLNVVETYGFVSLLSFASTLFSM